MGVGGKRESKKESDPPSAVDGLEGIDKRVGSWGKKRKNDGVKATKKRVGSWGKKNKVKESKRQGASTSGLTSAAQ